MTPDYTELRRLYDIALAALCELSSGLNDDRKYEVNKLIHAIWKINFPQDPILAEREKRVDPVGKKYDL